MKRDYYDVMGVAKDASDDVIKAAYRKLARKYHPDVSKEQDSDKKFKELGEAYSVLKDLKKRSVYDSYGHDAPALNPGRTQPAPDMDDILRQARAAYTAGEGRGSYRDTTQYVNVPLFMMINGGPFVANVMRQTTRSVGGVIASFSSVTPVRIVIPPNSRKNDKIVVDEGNGKATLVLHPSSDRYWHVEGLNIAREFSVDVFEAMIGDTKDVYDPWNKKVGVKIPGGSNSSTILRLRGRGLEDNFGRKGDMFLQLNVSIPTLNAKQKDILKEAISKIRS